MKKFTALKFAIVFIACALIFAGFFQLAYAADPPKVSPELEKLYNTRQQVSDLAFRTAGKIDYANKLMLEINKNLSRDIVTMEAQLAKYQTELQKIGADIKKAAAKKPEPAPKPPETPEKGESE